MKLFSNINYQGRAELSRKTDLGKIQHVVDEIKKYKVTPETSSKFFIDTDFLNLRNSKLLTLPPEFTFMPGSVYITDSTIENLGNLRLVTKDLIIYKTQIQYLPEDLKVDNMLRLHLNPNLKELPNNLNARFLDLGSFANQYYNFDCPLNLKAATISLPLKMWKKWQKSPNFTSIQYKNVIYPSEETMY